MSRLDKLANLAHASGSGRSRLAGVEDQHFSWMTFDVEDNTQLAEVLSWAASNEVFVIRGRSEEYLPTLSAFSNPFVDMPSDSEEAEVAFINLDGLNRIVEYTPEDMVISVESGISLEALDELTSNHGQWLPVHLRNMGRLLADIVDTGDGGYLETMFGGTRSLVLGMSVATTAGESIKTGGKVVKNVTGYDLSKLFIGSRGWLGIPHLLHLRLFARPSSRRCLIVKSEAPGHLVDLAAKLASTGLPLSCVEILDGRVLLDYCRVGDSGETAGGTEGEDSIKGRTVETVVRELLSAVPLERESAVMLIGIDGHEKVVEEVVSEVESVVKKASCSPLEIAGELGSELFALSAQSIGANSDSIQVELSLALRDMKYLLDTWWRESAQPLWHARPLTGRLRLAADDFSTVERWIESLKDVCSGLGHGFTLACSTPRYGYAVRRLDVSEHHNATTSGNRSGDDPWAGSRIQETLKHKFDPARILNPLVHF
ncbi:MAG: FAD-binding oxidoreductase [Cyanobacteria bacterium]|nr:FAD-binding oxidoreductase [Cyanobacteriota bacterium]